MSTLRICRNRAWQDKLRAYKIVIDGKEVGSVSEGMEATFALEPGDHTVQLKIDWCNSPVVNISLAPGQEALLQCGANCKPFLALLNITLWRNKYIFLRPSA